MLDQCLTDDGTLRPRGIVRGVANVPSPGHQPKNAHLGTPVVTLRGFARCMGENPDLTVVDTGFES